MNSAVYSSYYQQPEPVYRFEDFLSYIPKDSIEEFMALEKSLTELCIEELWVRYGCVLKMKQITEGKLREMNLRGPMHKRLMVERLVKILDREYDAVTRKMWRHHYHQYRQ